MGGPRCRSGVRTVCNVVPVTKEVMVNVCSYVPKEVSGTHKRVVCSQVPEVVTYQQTYCEMVPYLATVRVPVCVPVVAPPCGTPCDPPMPPVVK